MTISPAALAELKTHYIDVSVPLRDNMLTWPGDPPVSIRPVIHLNQGDPATVRHLSMGSHTGTHVDAFSHFKPNGKTLCQMSVTPWLGRAKVIEIEHPHAVTRNELLKNDLSQVERVLFKTQNSTQAKPWYDLPFNPDFVHIQPEAATYLVEQGIQLVGMDYLSVDSFHVGERVPVHHILMDAGVYILEGLYLAQVPAGWVEMQCLPLLIADGDGAPARVVVRPAHPPLASE